MHLQGFFTPKMHLWENMLRKIPVLSLDLLSDGEKAHCPFPKTSPMLSAFGLNFRPHGPQRFPPNSNLWLQL